VFEKLRCLMVVTLCSAAFGVGQSAPESPNTAAAPTTIHVTSRTVYIDVVVKDRGGKIVHGLTQGDFKLEEDGKPQTVDYFAAHSYDLAASQQAAEAASKAAARREFSNVAQRGVASGAVNIILFDLVNTPPSDQFYARKQLLKFLTTLPPGQQVALFVLTDRLHMVQNFTGSSDRLAQAARLIRPEDFRLIESKSETMEDLDLFAGFAKAVGRGGGAMMATAKDDAAFSSGAGLDIRTRATLAALADLARATGGYSGRKNLLWLSESFPLTLDPDMATRFDAGAVFPGERDTANLLASVQMAVYPISLLGLETSGVGAETSGAGETSLVGAPMSTPLNPQMNDTLKGQFTDRALLKERLNDVASETGGEAFVGTNDFARALRAAMNDGSNYCTLAYRPSNKDWKGQFRKVRVEVPGKNYSLEYRHGYYAFPEMNTVADSAQALKAAISPDTPEATMLQLKSSIDMPSAQHKPVAVHSALDVGGLNLAEGADGHRRGKLLVMLVAFNDAPGGAGKQAGVLPQTSAVLNLDFDASQFQAMMSQGISFTQQLLLPPGQYRLRLGVSDLNSYRLGTLDMPIVIAAQGR
jgi:VWFA-related protein